MRYFTPHVECFYPSPSDEHVAVPASRPHKFIRDRSDPKTPRAALAYPRLQRAQQPPQQPPQRPNLKARTRSRQKRNVWVHRKTLLCSPEKRIFRYHTTQINTITGVQKNEIVVKYQRLPVNGQRWPGGSCETGATGWHRRTLAGQDRRPATVVLVQDSTRLAVVHG